MGLKNFKYKNKTEAGCDEAGRGCLAGPVFAAAVILPPNLKLPLLDDSKKLNEKQRYELREIIEKKALAWDVQLLDQEKIDEINILNASILAMQNAVENLKIQPDLILVDGNRFKPFSIPFECIIKGDGIYKSIAAASILAKTYRDDYMNKIAEEFPQYSWKKNKGYPTKKHRLAIAEHGACKHHRKSFALLPNNEQYKLF